MEQFFYESKPVLWIVIGLGSLVVAGVSFLNLALAIGLVSYAINISLLRRNYRRNVFSKFNVSRQEEYFASRYPGRIPQSRLKPKGAESQIPSDSESKNE